MCLLMMSLSKVCSSEQANAEITLIDQSATPFGIKKTIQNECLYHKKYEQEDWADMG
jgi:hypothetical protein